MRVAVATGTCEERSIVEPVRNLLGGKVSGCSMTQALLRFTKFVPIDDRLSFGTFVNLLPPLPPPPFPGRVL